MAYAMLPVKPRTKQLVDEIKRQMGASSYDETVLELAQTRGFLLIKDLKGSLSGAPAFKRDKNGFSRDFG